jgi:pilus assembly protein Flp/PilA
MKRDTFRGNFRARLNAWLGDETGVTSIEYALIALLIAVVIVAAVTSLGRELKNSYDYIAHCVANLSCD